MSDQLLLPLGAVWKDFLQCNKQCLALTDMPLNLLQAGQERIVITKFSQAAKEVQDLVACAAWSSSMLGRGIGCRWQLDAQCAVYS